MRSKGEEPSSSRCEQEENRKYPPLGDYGVIGDLKTVALVGPGARIDMLCFPEFDSPSVFAAHVDDAKGGHFDLTPELEDANEIQQYFPDTNILLSRFLSEEGIAEVSDFMNLQVGRSRQALVRRAKAVNRKTRFRLRCAPRFNYARSGHETTKVEGGVLLKSDDDLSLRLRSNVPLEIEGCDCVAEFTLEAGESALFILEDVAQDDDFEPLDFSSKAFKATSDYWRAWCSQCTYTGHWRDAVLRSALALKLLVSEKHGSIVAAPTFGFPSEVGGERNWDYRYVWLRDASFTVYAFLRVGFTEEAHRFMQWLQRRIEELADGRDLQTIYRLDGSRVEGEFQLEHLEGYRKSKPIRVGSTNHDQLQLDIYGEIMDAVYLFEKHGKSISNAFWKSVVSMIDHVSENWREPDASIWEVRGGEREFLYSRVMCWVAVDRAIRLSNRRSLPAPIERWRALRDEIYNSVFEEFWNEELEAFVQFKGAEVVDAAVLIMPLVRFISPTDPQWLKTLEAIERELAEDSLVYRYRVNEAFPEKLEGKDSTFTICSFWLIECVARAGDLQKARYLFEKMQTYGNSLGLYAEQINVRGELLGNIPQAFSHLALISAAYDLDRRLKKEAPEVTGASD
ncbi:glycoside hydrolase family 15 protein [Pelagicoccus sp. SDUM812003]|uniref:glycoside hydrolase family 15 protein n=1 Tax=Pelagicoccus sp. SDUM812003 TaxID=3041267 RepID=UPI00280D041D|nr:glycoside hydrolase family 15 protein [Pelagicoccus sp. SDUM812003]MDQ8204353.1 glycoside hydrolase family 15 protein [Pelagicoccus sp. SDUM812003]